MLDDTDAAAEATTTATVIDIKTRKRTKKDKSENSEGPSLQTRLDSLMERIEDHFAANGIRVGFGDDAFYVYTDASGVWRTASTIDREDLTRVVAKLSAECGIVFASKPHVVWTSMKASERFRLDPSGFNTLPYVAMRTRTLKLDTMESVPHSPDYLVTRRIDADYDAGAKCPGWLEMLVRVFSDRDPPERAAIVDFLQEWFGVALFGGTDRTPRSLRKVLFLYGPPRTGKSTILDVLRKLLGTVSIATARVKDTNAKFGLESFMNASAWISEEAAGLDSLVDASRVKAIITGEPLSVPRKYATDATLRFSGPVAWSSNSKPNFLDETAAIYDRVYLLSLDRQFSEEDSIKDFGKLIRPEDWLEERNEYPGIVNWALRGYQRVLTRGKYHKVLDLDTAGESWREQNDPIFAFVRECCSADPGVYNTTTALSWAAVEYMKSMDQKFIPLRSIRQRLKSVVRDVYPGTGIARPVVEDGPVRQPTVIHGVRLTEKGLRYLERAQAESDTVSLETKYVNVTGWGGKSTKPADAVDVGPTDKQ